MTNEQACAKAEELGKFIAEAIEKKTEPIKEFDELSTLLERHHDFICSKLLALGQKAIIQNPEFEGEPTAEQLEEHKQHREAADKEWEARCQQRDAFMKTVFENPAFWVLEEKILMKFEVSALAG